MGTMRARVTFRGRGPLGEEWSGVIPNCDIHKLQKYYKECKQFVFNGASYEIERIGHYHFTSPENLELECHVRWVVPNAESTNEIIKEKMLEIVHRRELEVYFA